MSQTESQPSLALREGLFDVIARDIRTGWRALRSAKGFSITVIATLALGIGAAALAAILLIAYLVQYRSSVNDSTAPTPVLVAKNLIPKGTSGTVIAEKQLFQAATLSKDDLKVGAISDPAYLNGRVAVADIFPGQQITTADLSAGLTDAIPTQLSGIQRAVAISIGATQGLTGYVASGDRVDVYYRCRTRASASSPSCASTPWYSVTSRSRPGSAPPITSTRGGRSYGPRASARSASSSPTAPGRGARPPSAG